MTSVKLGSGDAGKFDYQQLDKGLDVYDEAAVKHVVSAIVARHARNAILSCRTVTFGELPTKAAAE
jgi:hypothetical protein